MIAVSVDPLQGVDPEENTGQGIQQIVVEKGLLQVSVKMMYIYQSFDTKL